MFSWAAEALEQDDRQTHVCEQFILALIVSVRTPVDEENIPIGRTMCGAGKLYLKRAAAVTSGASERGVGFDGYG
jgi:hypothetical protein